MNIIIPTIGTRGDVQPFIALAQGLASAGHTVTLLSHPVMRALVESHSVCFAPIGPDVDMDEVAAGIRERSRNPWAGLIHAMKFSFEILEKSHTDILEGCRGADLVVISASGAAGKNEAEKLGLPYASVTLMPWGIRYDEPGRPLHKRILYGAIDEFAVQITTRPLNRLRKRQGLPPLGPEGFGSPMLDLIPISPVVYPPNPHWDSQHHITGYWFVQEPPGWQPPDGLLAFLDMGETPLVVSLGAMSRGLAGAHETASMFVDAIQQAGVRAIVQGWEAALKEMSLPATIYPSGPLPYGWLLPHSAGIVHHGGFGTTAAGLRAGIPALVVPHIADQFYWGQKVYDLGVGPRPIPRGKLDTPKLVDALKELLENRNYRMAASQLGEQIRSENGIVNAVRLLEEAIPPKRTFQPGREISY
jgi:sterol 3beta-glucosyltransferase